MSSDASRSAADKKAAAEARRQKVLARGKDRLDAIAGTIAGPPPAAAAGPPAGPPPPQALMLSQCLPACPVILQRVLRDAYIITYYEYDVWMCACCTWCMQAFLHQRVLHQQQEQGPLRHRPRSRSGQRRRRPAGHPCRPQRPLRDRLQQQHRQQQRRRRWQRRRRQHHHQHHQRRRRRQRLGGGGAGWAPPPPMPPGRTTSQTPPHPPHSSSSRLRRPRAPSCRASPPLSPPTARLRPWRLLWG